MKSKFVALTACAAALMISACTPPMPPELIAQLADKMVTCAEGQINFAYDEDLVDVGQSWSSEFQAVCSGVTVEEVDDTAQANVYLGELGQVPASCTVDFQVPVLLDGAVVTVTSENIDELTLDTATLAQILTRKITQWDDPAIADLNPDLELPAQTIIVADFASNDTNQALISWMSRIDPAHWSTTMDLPTNPGTQTVEALAIDGTIAVVPLSTSYNESLTQVGLRLPETSELAQPAVDAVLAAGTQLVEDVAGNIMTVTLDPSIEPQAQEGNNSAVSSWQAVVTKFAMVCSGADSLAGQALARYMLRTDAQGELDAAGFVAVPEALRLAAIDVISIGLPAPSLLPTDEATSTELEEPEVLPSDEGTDMIEEETVDEEPLPEDTEIVEEPTEEATP